MPPKRSSDVAAEGPTDSAGNPKLKLPRLDRGPEDFSSLVKTKLQSYTRTGQACDRCKVRKIRCDALPEGCSHCTTQSLACYVTDRVSGRTERRGYLQQLERDKTDMLSHIRELEQLLADNGVQVSPWQGPGHDNSYPPDTALDSSGNPAQDPSVLSKGQWQQVGSLWIQKHQHRMAPTTGYRYPLLESRPTEVYLGVSSDNAPLSSIKGTTLSVLGTSIDITSFDAPDMDEPPAGTPLGSPLYNKSVVAFLQTVLNLNPPLEHVELPSRQDAFTYAEWYFLMLSPFLPILHKPSFLQLLTRLYDDPSFKPSVPEQVIVHMVFATIYFQYGIRNREDPEQHAKLNDRSNKHYHWSLSKFCDLAVSQSVTSVQALAMIVGHTRNFPKPGCSSAITLFAFYKAIQLNLHRAVKLPGGGTNLDNEVRKRVWWAILGVMTTLNGHLGKPMPISLQDFDTEFPIAIPDEYLDEGGVIDPSKIGHCNYQVGLMGFKTVPLYMEMYANMYSVRRNPNTYVDVVRELDQGMQALYENLPDDLRPEKCKHSERMFAMYAQTFRLEFSLCLRHPSACMTNDPKICAENARICEQSATDLIKVVGELLRMKSLDTTWYQLAVYIAAVFSTLVSHWERRFDISGFEVSSLRGEMASWLEVIGEIGRLLGAGPRLASEVSAIMERTLGWIEHDMNGKSSSPSDRAGLSVNHINNSPPTPVSSDTPNEKSSTTTATNGTSYYNAALASTAPYPPLGYSDQPVGNSPGDQSSHQNGTTGAAFDPTTGASYQTYAPAGPCSGPNVSTPTLPSNVEPRGTPAPNPLIAFASQATQHVQHQQPPIQQEEEWRRSTAARQVEAQAQQLLAASQNSGIVGLNTWHDWTAAIADSQDRYSANALLTLGGNGAGGRLGDHHVQQVDPAGVTSPGDVMSAAAAAAAAGVGLGVNVGLGVENSHAGQWPLLLFHDGTGGGTGTGGG